MAGIAGEMREGRESAAGAAEGGAGSGDGMEGLVRETFEAAFGPATVVAGAVRATAQADVVSVDVVTSQRDFVRDTKRRVARTVVVQLVAGQTQARVVDGGTAVDVASESAALQSATDARLRVVLRNEASKRFVEVWRDGQLVRSHDVTAAHGRFYSDSTFGSLAWANDNSHVLYAAEQPEPKSESGSGDARQYAADASEDWGETFSGWRAPVLVALRLADGAARVVETAPGVSPGQALFLPGAEHRIAYIGYAHGARRPGLVYCQNRPSALFVGALHGEAASHTCVFRGAVRSPRLTPSGGAVVFLSTAVGGPHAAASALLRYTLATGAVDTAVPVVDCPADAACVVDGVHLPPGFPGLFADQLPRTPWLRCAAAPDREVLVLTSVWRSTAAVVGVDVGARRVACHSPVDATAAAAVLGCGGDTVAAVFSTPAAPGSVAVGRAALAGADLRIDWFHIGDGDGSSSPAIAWSIVPAPAEHGDSACESIFVRPAAPAAPTRMFWPPGSAEHARPLVVMPHGGPHSAYTLEYNALAAGLARLGFGVLLVNFTGSLGFGQRAVLAQVGRMDSLTLAEIQAAAGSVHAARLADPRRTVYMGGSYAGYTGALLAARAAGFYRALVLRNPVVALADNAAMSDIPDWCWAELGLPYSFAAPPPLTPAVYAQMWSASPASMVDAVRDPILLLLGAADRRVPPPQSRGYYARLKAAGKPVQCRVYPAVGHPLDSVEAERDSFVSTTRFFAAALK
ncbi:hypothetical protein LPJ53_000281 [Coemansia erecta]|uniref:acylaminoacyl-peptidase n=1 Tax=Coemansia erecta TaxID=147472 RepID=A0A9W7Y2C4_9FUNG|nr:hypothetical protein LPJ53_000281 [Coemansia erecta]